MRDLILNYTMVEEKGTYMNIFRNQSACFLTKCNNCRLLKFDILREDFFDLGSYGISMRGYFRLRSQYLLPFYFHCESIFRIKMNDMVANFVASMNYFEIGLRAKFI